MRSVTGAVRVLAALTAVLFAGCAATSGPLPVTFLDPPAIEPVVLAGLLKVDETVAGRWAFSGAWEFPVGDPLTWGASDADGGTGYRVNRGISGAPRRHDGADLSNQRGGGEVRAAANGIVVRVAPSGGGYGAHVVLAHRLASGGLAYSVYGHLEPGSFRVARGEAVAAGQPIGRVGRTGRASSHHLHFEVRLTDDPAAQWPHADPVDPIAFVTARLPAGRADTTWAGPYLVWGELCGLVADGAAADAPLRRSDWWAMLARAGRRGPDALPQDPDSLRPALVGAGLLPLEVQGAAADPLPWPEAERDLVRLAEIGARLTPCPVDPQRHEEVLTSRLPWSRPGSGDRTPTLADALLVLADVSLQRARAGH